MLFSTAGIEISPWVPPAVAFVISFFTSMGGVSGAFLLLPFQVSVLGFISPSVSPTNQLFNIIAIPGGVYRYIKEGRLLWPLALLLIIGTLPGIFIGALIRILYLPDPRHFKFFAGLVLLYIGARLVLSQFQDEKDSSKQFQAEQQFRRSIEEHASRTPDVTVQAFSFLHIEYTFSGFTFTVNNLGIMLLSCVVGVIGGIYGIGGGAIIAPFIVTFFRLPVFTIAGATLLATFVSSIGGVLFYHSMAPSFPGQVVAPDYLLGLFFGVGGFAGMYCGAKCQKFFPAGIIKWILALCILLPAFTYIWNFFF